MKKSGLLFVLMLALSLPGFCQIADKPEDISPLLVGEKLPDLLLASADGQSVQTSSLWKSKKAIVIVYRGGWCPYCNAHLAEMVKIEKDLLDLGYTIIAMSTDSPENLKKTMDKHQMSYALYSDSDGAFAKAAGLAFKAPERYAKTLTEGSNGKNKDLLLPVPALFIVNTDGEILFEHINPNFKVRVSGDMLLSVAKVLATKK